MSMYFNMLFAVKHFHIFPLRVLLNLSTIDALVSLCVVNLQEEMAANFNNFSRVQRGFAGREKAKEQNKLVNTLMK